ncbi:hypothetical protein EFM1CSP_20325 [Enterococcus faecium]|nr:hypothetical protein EFM1CSP_20325 [Enterococcus faecium]
MAKETEDKLAKLAKESGNDFKKLDEMEKEFKLNESKVRSIIHKEEKVKNKDTRRTENEKRKVQKKREKSKS